MTSTQSIKLTVLFMTIICLVAWYVYNGASASDMDCFRLESAIMEHKNSKWFKKIKAYKAVKSLTLLCNQSK